VRFINDFIVLYLFYCSLGGSVLEGFCPALSVLGVYDLEGYCQGGFVRTPTSTPVSPSRSSSRQLHPSAPINCSHGAAGVPREILPIRVHCVGLRLLLTGRADDNGLAAYARRKIGHAEPPGKR